MRPVGRERRSTLEEKIQHAPPQPCGQNPHDRGRICRLHRAAETLTPEQIAYTYASEADLLNVALFGQTAKQWKNNNPGKKGNVRDDANLNQLLVLANMESYNAILIEQGKPQSERLILLRNLAIRQMDTLASISLMLILAYLNIILKFLCSLFPIPA